MGDEGGRNLADGFRTAGKSRRGEVAPPVSRAQTGGPDHEDAWNKLRIIADAPKFGPDARIRLITCRPEDPASVAFDLLRTRILRTLQTNGWSRVAITSPTAGCGASFTAANLALSLARLPHIRTALVDLNLRAPGLADTFNIRKTGAIEPFLAGKMLPAQHLFRIGQNLALCLNDTPVEGSVAMLQHPNTIRVLNDLNRSLLPQVTIYDLPPMLEADDAEAFLPQVDGVLLVSDGGRTDADQLRECERLLNGQPPLLGVVLNRAEDGAG